LTEVASDEVTQELLGYLASYSGAECLVLDRPNAGDRCASNRIADLFYNTALSATTSSLVELYCPAGFESRWSFGAHNVDVISRLHRLTRLTMSVN
ncbi:hypothetical protein FB451DRAFT_989874, partial [Mycena latifolia]